MDEKHINTKNINKSNLQYAAVLYQSAYDAV